MACGTGESTSTEKADVKSDPTTNPDYKKGLALVAQSDCLTCHKVNEASTGP
ncbi:MAG: cytochrome c class I, partial [Bacteroidetes bacterium]